MNISRYLKILYVFVLAVSLSACSNKGQPSNIDSLCSIFSERPHWYKAAKRSAQKWGGNIHVPMAIMYQESSFKAKARPPKRYILGVIPRGRASDAYGFSQALKSTWSEYEQAIGSRWARRDSFADSIDFINWYMHESFKRNGSVKSNARDHYLNYHEGQGGFSRGTYRDKEWLLKIAERVQQRAARYANQLARCR